MAVNYDIMQDKQVMNSVYSQFPRNNSYANLYLDGKHTCTEYIIYCKGDTDIVRCTKCGNERVTRCTFDDDYA